MGGGAIVLAAGSSRRFGSDKRRYRLPDGQPLLLATVARYASVFPDLIVVLRPEDDELTAQLEEQAAQLEEQAGAEVRIVRCPEAHLGMGHSLACGARAATGWRYLFVALGDMPWVRPQTLEQLRAALTEAGPEAVVQPAFRSTAGHPVGFAAGYLPALTRLTGDTGARAVLRGAGSAHRLIHVDDPGVLEDLDRPPEG